MAWTAANPMNNQWSTNSSYPTVSNWCPNNNHVRPPSIWSSNNDPEQPLWTSNTNPSISNDQSGPSNPNSNSSHMTPQWNTTYSNPIASQWNINTSNNPTMTSLGNANEMPKWNTNTTNNNPSMPPQWNATTNNPSIVPQWNTSANNNSSMPPQWNASANNNSSMPPQWNTSTNNNSSMPPQWNTETNNNSSMPPQWNTETNNNSSMPPQWNTETNNFPPITSGWNVNSNNGTMTNNRISNNNPPNSNSNPMTSQWSRTSQPVKPQLLSSKNNHGGSSQWTSKDLPSCPSLSNNQRGGSQIDVRFNSTSRVSATKSSSSQRRSQLCELISGQTGVRVVGLVIAKETPRVRRVKEEERSVMSFTIRDSLHDWCNVTCWAGIASGKKIAASFHIADVVLLTNAQVLPKEEGSYAERFQVSTPMFISLSINDRAGSIQLYTGRDKENMLCLQNLLTFPPSDHIPIAQIVQFAHQNLFVPSDPSASTNSRPPTRSEHLTFFAAVKKVGEPRDLLSSLASAGGVEEKRRVLHRCESTTISVVDCCIKWDTYRRGVIGTVDSRTVVVVNPDSTETLVLHQYAQSMSLANTEVHDWVKGTTGVGGDGNVTVLDAKESSDDVPLSSIHTVVTIQIMKSRQVDSGFGIVFAILSRLDIDSENMADFTVSRCSNCRRRLNLTQMLCTSFDCPLVGQELTGTDRNNIIIEYGCVVHLADHTGTSTRCYSSGPVLDELLGISALQFRQLSVQERTKIKWKVLLKRFKVYFRIALPTFNNPDPYTKILAFHQPNFHEVVTSLKI